MVVPTIPGSFEQLQENLNKIIINLGRVPFDKIGGELELMLKEARNTLKQVGDLAGKLDKETAPQAQATIKELHNTLIGLQQAIGKESPLNYNARKALTELTETLRAVRELADTLENRPQSIIFGKEGEKNHE